MCFDGVAVFNQHAKFELNSYLNRWISLGTGGLKVGGRNVAQQETVTHKTTLQTSGTRHHPVKILNPN